MTDPAPITREGAQHAAQHELSKSVYHRNSDPLAVRAVRWVGHAIDHGLNYSLKHSGTGGLGALAGAVVIVVAVVLIIWRVGVPRRIAAAGAVLPTGSITSAADHRSRSESAAANDDWHTAVVERMRAIARELEQRSILDPRAGRTATELAREAGAVLPVAAADLRNAAEVFNAIAYGGGEADRADLDVMIAADEGILRSGRSKVLAT